MRISLSCILLLSLATGCRSLAEYRAREDANASWQQTRPLYAGIPHDGVFGAGYRTGYVRAAAGKLEGHPEPPRRLRQPQDKNGYELQQAWYDGYSHGVLAAQDDVRPAQQHETLDTTIVHEHIHPGAGAPMTTETVEMPAPLGTVPTDLPPTTENPGAMISTETKSSTGTTTETQSPASAPLDPVESQPKFVPPPPAPPVEEVQAKPTTSTQQVSHSQPPKKDATMPAGGQRPSQPAVKAPQYGPKNNRAEWQMPVLDAKKKVFGI
jgi:hypothetical protein